MARDAARSSATLARDIAILSRALRSVLARTDKLEPLSADERTSLDALRRLVHAELGVVDDYIDLGVLPLPFDGDDDALETAVRAANAVLFGCMILDLRRADDAAAPAWARLQAGVESFFRLVVPSADPLDDALFRCLFDAEVRICPRYGADRAAASVSPRTRRRARLPRY